MYLDNELPDLIGGDNFSKISSLHKRSKIGCHTYRALVDFVGGDSNMIALNELKEEPNFYNIALCRDVCVSDDDVLQMMEQFQKHNEKYHFVPFIEVAREFSNLVFVIETNIQYSNNMYKFKDEFDVKSSLQMICKRVYKMMKLKTDMRVCVYIRAHKRKVYLKMQFLDQVMDIHNRVHLTKQVASIIESLKDNEPIFNTVYPIRYNEFYGTSILPMAASPEHYYWDIYSVFECKNKYGTHIAEVGKDALFELCNSPGNTLAILSINPYNTHYKKTLYSSSSEIERYEPSNVNQRLNIMLIKYMNEYPRLAFTDLVLRYLPSKIKEENYKDIIYSLKVEGVEHIDVLARYHFPWVENFDKMWYSAHKRFSFGYYANLVSNLPEYKVELDELIERIIEKEFYSGTGCVSDYTCAMIINFYFYGKFYSYAEIGKSKSIRHDYMFVDIQDQAKENSLYKWQKYGESTKVSNFISEHMFRVVEQVGNKLAITGSSHSKDEHTKELNKRKTSFNTSNRMLRDTTKYTKIMVSLYRNFVNSPTFPDRMDKAPDVVGVINGVLYLDLASADPKPIIYQCYSPHIVTKSCNVKYIPYEEVKLNGKFITKIKGMIKSIIPEKDARMKILYFASTGLDQMIDLCKVLLALGWGCNGKSTIFDNIVNVLNDYATKLSSTLLTQQRKGSAADPEFMAMKDKSFGLIAETNRNDKLVSARLKSATEVIKDGRGLYEDCGNFGSKVTLAVCSNYPVRMEDFDDGTTRRIMVYRHKIKFVNNPDPKNPNEKKLDPECAHIFKNKRAKNEFFSWLVHLRCKFHKLYKSDIDKVPSPTIDAYTASYICEQDLLTQFIYQRIVFMIGYDEECKLRLANETEVDAAYDEIETGLAYNHKIMLTDIVEKYREWSLQYARTQVNEGYNTLLDVFKISALGRYINDDMDLAYLRGMRVLELGKIKHKGESHIPVRK